MNLVVPALEYLEAYADALRRGFWSDNLRREESAREELAMIAADPADFLASLDDPEGKRKLELLRASFLRMSATRTT